MISSWNSLWNLTAKVFTHTKINVTNFDPRTHHPGTLRTPIDHCKVFTHTRIKVTTCDPRTHHPAILRNPIHHCKSIHAHKNQSDQLRPIIRLPYVPRYSMTTAGLVPKIVGNFSMGTLLQGVTSFLPE